MDIYCYLKFCHQVLELRKNFVFTMNAKSFSIKWDIVDGYKVIRKIHNDAKKSFKNAVFSENFRVSEVDRYLP